LDSDLVLERIDIVGNSALIGRRRYLVGSDTDPAHIRAPQWRDAVNNCQPSPATLFVCYLRRVLLLSFSLWFASRFPFALAFFSPCMTWSHNCCDMFGTSSYATDESEREKTHL